MNESLLHLLYDTHATGGWTGGIARLTMALVDGLSLPASPTILEAGCGSGAFVRALRTRLPNARVAGLDLNPLALGYALAQTPPPAAFLQGNLLHLPAADQSIDLLLALDAFDQVAVPLGAALAEARRVLRPGGVLLLRMSAHPWLQGAHDAAFNTGRRVTRFEIETALRGAGLLLRRITYANMLLAPPVIALRLIENSTRASQEQVAREEATLYASPLANRVLAAALHLEALWLRRANLPFGLSLLAAAQSPA